MARAGDLHHDSPKSRRRLPRRIGSHPNAARQAVLWLLQTLLQGLEFVAQFGGLFKLFFGNGG